MEALREREADTAAGANPPGFSAAALLQGRILRSVPASGAGFRSPGPASVGGAAADLQRCLGLLDSALSTAPDELGATTFPEAADFAEIAEELSRRVEYLQLLAAAAVEKTRSEAIIAAGSTRRTVGWTTGWGTDNAVAATTSATVTTTATASAAASYPMATGIGLPGHAMPANHEEVAAALATATISSRAGTIITTALERVRHIPDSNSLARMEHSLTRTALENDQDFLTRIARRWVEAIDQDGTEPSEQELRHRQGAFLRRTRRGLHHVEIFATAEQYEHLLTVMNVATNPRNANSPGRGAPDNPTADSRNDSVSTNRTGAGTADHRDLLNRLETSAAQGPRGPQAGSGTFIHTGPASPATIRKIACDADIIPIVLGGNGRVLDIGRTTRIFPSHIRKALTARDQGCAFPNCTMPAPWCEARHIDYWSRGGSTSTANGVLLCTHHHHLVHKEQWKIRVTSGVPWFIPPPHIDPKQEPRQNHHHRT
ncbi:DUF222 domain-containing protein [Arthrobacter sp. FW306-04-A]|uniref:HNH endonuclease signature motif containing protein n=1 Tax=Arthrobacter sp. FW306-04-A TaxID=2879619 RepID=UPI0037C0494E|nr:HNH endonuclease [Arthrobacter sp. FW306-04-A]